MKKEHHGKMHHKGEGDNLYRDGTGDSMSNKSKGDHTVKKGMYLNDWEHEKPMHTEMGSNPKWGAK